MNTIEIKVKKLRENAIVPKSATVGSAGSDLHACLYDEETGEDISKIIIQPNQRVKIHTGLAFQVPENHVILIDVRSSSGTKKGLMLQNTIGILDSDYRGECLLFVTNTLSIPIEIENGERIAQALVLPCPTSKYIVVDSLDKTERGEGGFGSTGKF